LIEGGEKRSKKIPVKMIPMYQVSMNYKGKIEILHEVSFYSLPLRKIVVV
jgi:hypothetical protein